MTPAEFRAILDRLGLSQLGAARLLGVDGRTCRRYASGDAAVPEPTARFLRYLVAARVTPEDVTRALANYAAA